MPTHAVKEPTLLGEAFGPDGDIDPAGVDRVVVAVNKAMAAARQLGVQQLYVFTTSAVRDAANRDLILDRVEAEAGVRPQYLSGEAEARLTYLAVHQWYGWSAGRLLILDIGGGSMEIVLGRDAEPEFAMSLPLGAGRLTRAFLPDDPPGREQVAALRQYVNATLREVADRLLWEGVPERAIGTSKTFKQLARLTGAPAQRKGAVRQAARDREGHRHLDPAARRPPGKGAGQATGRGDQGPPQRRPGRIVAGLADDLVDVPVRVSCFPGRVPAMRPGAVDGRGPQASSSAAMCRSMRLARVFQVTASAGACPGSPRRWRSSASRTCHRMMCR